MESLLIIEEDNDLRYGLRDLVHLKFPHVQVFTAATGADGLEMASQHQPSLILVDSHLAKMPGYEVVSQLRQMHVTRQIPLIAITAPPRNQDMWDTFMQQLCDGCLMKPFSADQVVRAIQSFFNGWSRPLTIGLPNNLPCF